MISTGTALLCAICRDLREKASSMHLQESLNSVDIFQALGTAASNRSVQINASGRQDMQRSPSASALYPFQIHFFEIITFAQVDIVQLGHFYFV